MTSTSWAW